MGSKSNDQASGKSSPLLRSKFIGMSLKKPINSAKSRTDLKQLKMKKANKKSNNHQQEIYTSLMSKTRTNSKHL